MDFLLLIDNSVKEDVNKKAFEKAVQNKKAEVNIKDKPTERYTSNFRLNLIQQNYRLNCEYKIK